MICRPRLEPSAFCVGAEPGFGASPDLPRRHPAKDLCRVLSPMTNLRCEQTKFFSAQPPEMFSVRDTLFQLRELADVGIRAPICSPFIDPMRGQRNVKATYKPKPSILMCNTPGRGILSCRAFGVRPSSGAAALPRTIALDPSRAFLTHSAAAPEDGRTPGWSFGFMGSRWERSSGNYSH